MLLILSRHSDLYVCIRQSEHTPTHVDTKDNLADILTKFLPVGTLERLRERLMFNPDAEEL